MICPILEADIAQKQGIIILHSEEPHRELSSLALFSEEKNQVLADYFMKEFSGGKKIVSDTLGVGQWIVAAVQQSAKRPFFPLRNAGGIAVDFIRKYSATEIALVTENLNSEQVAAVTEGLVLGDYEYIKAGNEATMRELRFSKLDHLDQKKIKLAAVTSTATNEARAIADTPPNILTPTAFAALGVKLAEDHGLTCNIIDEAEMKELGMEAILAVSQGSAQEAKMICLEYKNPKATQTITMV